MPCIVGAVIVFRVEPCMLFWVKPRVNVFHSHTALIHFMDNATSNPASLECRSVRHLKVAGLAFAEVVLCLPTAEGFIWDSQLGRGHQTAHPIAKLAPA